MKLMATYHDRDRPHVYGVLIWYGRRDACLRRDGVRYRLPIVRLVRGRRARPAEWRERERRRRRLAYMRKQGVA